MSDVVVGFVFLFLILATLGFINGLEKLKEQK